jgi:hypothetical protein
MIFVQDNSVQSINAALNVIQKNQTPAQASRGRRFSISVSGNAISCYIPDFPKLVANVTTVKLILPQLDTGSPTLNINGLGAKPIKAVRDGQLIDIVSHQGFWSGATRSSDNTQRVARVWDNNTTLELIYDGTNWVVVGNPGLCSYYSGNYSYIVYTDGLIHQWGTYDKGSDTRSVFSTAIFPVQYTNEGSYMINIAGVRAGDGNFVGVIGVRARQSYSAYMGWYGLSESDLARYLKWETLGL